MPDAVAVAKPEARSKPRSFPVRVRGRYDAAQTSDNNRRQWEYTDALSADAANSPSVRKVLRERCRYVVQNNSYARGAEDTYSNDVVGTGPRLQLLTDNPKLNQQVERDFADWGLVAGLAESLRTGQCAEFHDGEWLSILTSNPTLDHFVQLDLIQIETEQVAGDYNSLSNPNDVDGIKIDAWGRPIEYRVLVDHPGGSTSSLGQRSVTVSADYMLHLFPRTRAGQHRGIPRLTPAIDPFENLRRFILATVNAAEAAADFVAVATSNFPPVDENTSRNWFLDVELERNMMMVLPDGYGLGQIDAKHPNAQFERFVREMLKTAGRCLGMPYGVLAGDHSQYNYASGRLDLQNYRRAIQVQQFKVSRLILDKIFRHWLSEYLAARRIPGMRAYPLPPHQWFWPGFPHVDPTKEAEAQSIRLGNLTSTLSLEWAEQGLDWEEQIAQIARERETLDKYGLQLIAPAPSSPESEVQQ